MSSPWFRMDQLLKCSICSNRFRNPKLLPCNHTFCAEPCLSKCIDKSNKHQIKCSECSAEHRIPIQGGVQGFPNNVTLVRFLELRQQVSGREPELPASMQKCNTCKEKGQLEMCAHCNRKVCKDCKKAHVNILRKEIALINGQVREGLQQLCNALNNTKENEQKLQKNYTQVKDEIEEVVRRYTRDLLDTESKLKHNLDSYLRTELRSMRNLEHDLQIELNNVNSNCDLVDKYVNNGVDWTDLELTDYKEIFQKTLEFLRAFDSDPTDCIRKVKFHPRSDPDVIHKTIIDFAEVKLSEEPAPQNSNLIENHLHNGGMYSSSTALNQNPSVTLTPPKGNALSRSQSDHKLCSQRQSQKWKDEDSESSVSKRFRDRFMREDRDSSERDIPNNRDHSPSSWRRELDEVRHNQKNRFSSKEIIEENEDSDGYSRNRPGMEESPLRDHVSGTEDATKGPLSGVIRILDSPHVMERLHHSEVRQKKEKEEEERKAKIPKPAPPPVSRPMTRQLSEDEIEKQKKENKAAAAASAAASAASNVNSKTSLETDSSRTPKPVAKKEEPPPRPSYTSKYSSPRTSTEDSNKSRNSTRDETSSPVGGRRKEDTQTPPSRTLRSWRTTSSAATERDASQSPPSSPTNKREKPPLSPRAPPTSNSRPTSRFLPKPSSLDLEDTTTTNTDTTPSRRTNFSTTTPVGRSSPLERPKLRLSIPQPSPSSSETSSSSESESEEEVDSETAVKRGDISPSVNTLLARSAQARKQSASTQARLLNQPEEKYPRPSNRPWRETMRKEEEPTRDSLSSRRKTSTAETETPYSRLLADRRRSSVTSGSTRTRDISPEDNSFASRRSRIARSKSSHDLCPAEDSPEDDTLSAIRNRYRTRRAGRDASPEEAVPHSWSQYMKNKYGNSGRPSVTNSGLVRSRTSASLVAPRSGSDNSSDEDTPPRRKTDYSSRRGDSNSPRGFSLPRRTYMQKGKTCFKFGSRGTDHGCFTWPRGVCVGNDNTIVVADSNNHRVQVFNSNGKYIQEFGSYGSNEGEFDCLAGVTVNRIGQFIVSDRYNHRLQVFDPNGRFIRAFGQEGRMDGKFNYPWGVATDNLGFVYVCDKENHRIQVFQGDGTYVTKFGGIGQRPGELEHPHYVAVSTTNRVIVSDSNNHRIQIYDVNGRLLSTFGTEGSEEGQFKYPRGVAVDDQGYLIVGDSGNNRIQIFHPDGTFLKAFGTWGSGDGEFKGLEGIAVTPTGQILACDRENHRIQVF